MPSSRPRTSPPPSPPAPEVGAASPRRRLGRRRPTRRRRHRRRQVRRPPDGGRPGREPGRSRNEQTRTGSLAARSVFRAPCRRCSTGAGGRPHCVDGRGSECGGADRRDRSLPGLRRPCVPRLSSPPACAERSPLRTARQLVRVPILRHALVRQPGVPGAGRRQRRVAPGGGAARGSRGDAGPASIGRSGAAMRRSRPAVSGSGNYPIGPGWTDDEAVVGSGAVEEWLGRSGRGDPAHRNYQSGRLAASVRCYGITLGIAPRGQYPARGCSRAPPRLTRRPPLNVWVEPIRSRPLAPLASVLSP